MLSMAGTWPDGRPSHRADLLLRGGGTGTPRGRSGQRHYLRVDPGQCASVPAQTRPARHSPSSAGRHAGGDRFYVRLEARSRARQLAPSAARPCPPRAPPRSAHRRPRPHGAQGPAGPLPRVDRGPLRHPEVGRVATGHGQAAQPDSPPFWPSAMEPAAPRASHRRAGGSAQRRPAVAASRDRDASLRSRYQRQRRLYSETILP